MSDMFRLHGTRLLFFKCLGVILISTIYFANFATAAPTSSSEATDSSSKFDDNVVYIIVAVVVVFVFVIVIVLVVSYFQMQTTVHRRQTPLQIPLQLNPPEIYVPSSVPVEESSSNSWWEIPEDKLKIYPNTVLGSGQFGIIVLGGVFRNGEETKCAIKTVKGVASEGEKHSLKLELKNMANMDPHPNIVNLIGAQTVNDNCLVVVEFCVNGDLYRYLKKHRGKKRWVGDSEGGTTIQYMARIRMAFDIANGMNYLAVKGFIHRDLAARNVLLDGELRAKVSDFGRARDVGETKRIYDSARVKNEPIPTRWMPIETLRHQKFTSKSDVWSFGVLLWEIESGGVRPYDKEQTFRQVVDKVVYEGYRLEKPSQCPDEIYEIMVRCWKIDPDERPSFRELAENIGEILKANLVP